MGFFSAISGFFGSVGETLRTNVKKDIKELEEKIEKEKNLKPESKLNDIKLDDVGENLNWQDLRSKQNIKEDLAKEKVEEKWEKLDKMLEDI